MPSSISRRTAGLARRRRISSSSASRRSSAPSSSTSKSALRVTRKTWRFQHPHAWKEAPQVGGDDVLQRDVDACLWRDQPSEQWRDLDPREVDQVRVRILRSDRQVERKVRDIGEWVARVDRQRRQHREDAGAEHGLQHARLSLVELRPAQDADAFLGQQRRQTPGTARPACWPGPWARSPIFATAGRRQPVRRSRTAQAGHFLTLQTGDANLEEPSRLLDAMARNFTRSRSGMLGSSPRASTRSSRRRATRARGSSSARQWAGMCRSHGEAARPEPPGAPLTRPWTPTLTHACQAGAKRCQPATRRTSRAGSLTQR